MGLINAVGLYYLNVQGIRVFNSTYQDKNFIYFSNFQSHSILNNIQLLNLSCNSIIYSKDQNQQFKTIIQDIYFKQVEAKHLVFNTNQSFIMRYVKINQSYIIEEIFYFVNAIEKGIHFDHINIQDTKTLKLFNFITNKIKVQQIHLINIKFQQDFQDTQVIYENSQSFNCTFQDQQVQIQNNILSVWNHSLDRSSPITLQLHNKSYFQQINISPNILQVQFDNSSIVYFPTGIPIEQYKQFNYKTKEQHQVYQHFAVVSNQKVNLKCYLDQKIDNISGNYANINQFILKYRVNIIENFTFVMNPYLNYTYIQNDIVCEDFEYVLRFNVRILPCQLGEYLYQNQCKTCDVNKFQYSVNKKAFLCNLIDINKIEKAKKGQLKLKPAFWRPSIDNKQIEFCNSELCKGGWNVGDESCVQGQVGALCKECDLNNIRGQGQYAKHDIGCLLCEFHYKLFLQGLIVIIWLMFLVYLSYDTNKQVIQQYLYFKISQRTLSDILMRQSLNQVSVIIKILTNYFFYLYLLKDNLHFLYYQVSVSLNLFNNPAKLISPQLDCILVEYSSIQIQYTNLLFNLITPFYILSSFYFIYMILLYFKVSQFQFNFIIITIYSVYLFNQQLILESLIKLLSSITISGIDWIYLNQQYQFNTKQHFNMIYKLVLPTTLLFILVPFIIYLQIQRKNKKSITIIKYYGILFREYKHETYFWEIVRIYQKFITIILIYIYNQQNKGYLIFLFQIQLLLVSYFQPYPLKNLNSLEQQSLVKLNWCLIVIFVMENIQEYFRGIIFAIINISILLEVIHQLIQKVKLQYKEQIMEVQTSIANKIPKLQRLIDMKKSQRVQQNILKQLESRQFTRKTQLLQFKTQVRNDMHQ
ncbi:hypothetical protein pb186bvf_011335 [Paramecium bursaria]